MGQFKLSPIAEAASAVAIDEARAALQACDPACSRDDWVRIAMAAKSAGIDEDTFHEWSARAENFSQRDSMAVWASVRPNGGIGPGTLFRMASQAGWKAAGRTPAVKPARGLANPAAGSTKARPGSTASEVWERSKPATADHGYIVAKQGTPNGLRVVPDGDPLRIAGHSVARWLVVPVTPLAGGEPVALQFIPPSGAGKKLNLPGAKLAGVFIVGDMLPGGTVYLCEGIGQAWACWKATGHAAVVCFGWGRVRTVAAELRKRQASVLLVLVPDVGKEREAEAIAREVAASFVEIPAGWEQNSDVNDLAQRDGFDVLEGLLSAPIAPEVPTDTSVANGHVIQWEFADQLADVDEAPDDLVEGFITRQAMSVLYGDSNSGKTFAAIDLAASIARGIEWMGRNVEQGLVIYLAAESPHSVRTRLRAYQRHHGTKVPNFVIVRSPIDLFDCEADIEAVVQLVRKLEKVTGRKCELIVGDTLARLSAGANENSGEDMGLVVRHVDRIRSETGSHFALIHHSGKDAAKGARGWSGLRAATDTEIEVTAEPLTGSHCMEITKQRDLPTGGDRIGFKLVTVHMGVGKWGSQRTSCIVVPTDAPAKAKSKRPSEIAGAVVEMLTARKSGIKKVDLVKHFDGRYDKSAVYREVKRMHEVGTLLETAGIVALPGEK